VIKKLKTGLYKSLFLVIIIVSLVWFLAQNISEIRMSFDTTASSLTGTMFLAIFVLMFSYWLYIEVFRKAFRLNGPHYGFLEMLKLQLSCLAVNIIIPSANAAGTMIFADESKERGYTRASAVVSYLTIFLAEYSAISILLGATVLYLFLNRTLGARVYLPSGLFVAVTFCLYYLLFAAAKPNGLARRIITWLANQVSKIMHRFSKKSYNAESVVKKLSDEMLDVKASIKKNPRILTSLIGMQFLVHSTRVLALALIFYSLGYHISPDVLLAGYIIGVVLVVVSPTPSGVGFVEGAMFLMYTSLGVPGHVASTATIVYRFLQFWLPFMIGLIMLQHNRINKIKMEVEALDAQK
jgi:uncharacterized protein (TIRG00374 family)